MRPGAYSLAPASSGLRVFAFTPSGGVPGLPTTLRYATNRLRRAV